MKRTTKHHIWLVGGGTGGHIVPILAVAHELKRDKAIVLTYIGEVGNDREAQLVAQAGLKRITIPTGKIRRYLSLSAFFLNIRDLFRLAWGTLSAFRLMGKHKPVLIFTKGGPLAMPIAWAARMKRIPIMTHESDAVMGGTNRFIARFATKVFTGFPASVYPPYLASKITSVGIPLREEFCEATKRSAPKHHRPMVLVTGGIQGALAINKAVAEILPALLPHASVMHITGDYSYAMMQEVKESLPKELQSHYAVVPFTPDIVSYMHEASVVVCRASSTIFELATLNKPMILIPLPTAANDHQRRNAELFVQQNAALMIHQSQLTSERLYETIMAVLEDKKLRTELKEGTRAFASCDAAKKVASLLRESV